MAARNTTIKHDFFTVIDSEIKAYLLGFHMGDGSCSKRTKGNHIEYALHVGVHEKDRYIIDLFAEHIAPQNTVRTRKPFFISADGNQYLCAAQKRISIYSQELVTSLTSMGLGPGKTYTGKPIPNIPHQLKRHFIRGYFDADGTCTNNLIQRSDRKTDTMRAKSIFHIPSWDREILESIKGFVDEELGIDLRVYDYKGKKVHYLKSSKLEEIHKLHAFFYTDAQYYFQRKKESFELTMLTPRELRALKGKEPRNA